MRLGARFGRLGRLVQGHRPAHVAKVDEGVLPWRACDLRIAEPGSDTSSPRRRLTSTL